MLGWSDPICLTKRILGDSPAGPIIAARTGFMALDLHLEISRWSDFKSDEAIRPTKIGAGPPNQVRVHG